MSSVFRTTRLRAYSFFVKYHRPFMNIVHGFDFISVVMFQTFCCVWHYLCCFPLLYRPVQYRVDHFTTPAKNKKKHQNQTGLFFWKKKQLFNEDSEEFRKLILLKCQFSNLELFVAGSERNRWTTQVFGQSREWNQHSRTAVDWSRNSGSATQGSQGQLLDFIHAKGQCCFLLGSVRARVLFVEPSPYTTCKQNDKTNKQKQRT